MRFASLFGLFLLTAIPSGEARVTYQRHARTTSDVCGDVNAPLIVNFLGIPFDVGTLSESSGFGLCC